MSQVLLNMWRAVLLVLPLATAMAAFAQVTPEPPRIRALGNERFQIGALQVDKGRAAFSVPGSVVDLGQPDAPVEFLVATMDSSKLYESLLQVNASALEFNLACILIGLDPKRGRAAAQHFDPAPVAGDAVDIHVRWEQAGVTVRHSAAALIQAGPGDPPDDDWVYTGSSFSETGRFMAQAHGVLVGMVHAPETLIEHRRGLGLGNYGAVIYNPDILPPPGTPVQVEVRRRSRDLPPVSDPAAMDPAAAPAPTTQ